MGGVAIGAAGHPFLFGDRQMGTDLVLKIVIIEVETAPLQPGKDGHGYSPVPGAVDGFITRPIAFTSSVQRDSSRTSCFLPSGVSR